MTCHVLFFCESAKEKGKNKIMSYNIICFYLKYRSSKEIRYGVTSTEQCYMSGHKIWHTYWVTANRKKILVMWFKYSFYSCSITKFRQCFQSFFLPIFLILPLRGNQDILCTLNNRTKAKQFVLRALQTEIAVMDTFEILTFMSTFNRDFF